MNLASDLGSTRDGGEPPRGELDSGAGLRALFARLGARRAGDWLETELREDLKRRTAGAENGLSSVVGRALVLEVLDGRAASPVRPGAGRPSLLDVLAVSATRLARRLPASRETIARALMSGESSGTTPVADGIALPHARLGGISRSELLLARCPRGVDPSRRSSRGPGHRRILAVLVLVGSAARPRRHLRLLAGLAARADNPRFLPRFLSAADGEALRDVLLRTAPRPARTPTRRPARTGDRRPPPGGEGRRG